jgi:hypothetical protein
MRNATARRGGLLDRHRRGQTRRMVIHWPLQGPSWCGAHGGANELAKLEPGAERGRRGGGLAEFERHLIRARTSEGRECARVRGVKMGRPPKLTAHQQRETIRRGDRGNETLGDIARTYNVSAATISRLAAARG